MVVAVAATTRLVDESISKGMMGMMLPIYAIPVLSLALVAWAVASRRLSSGLRRASMAASILLACAGFTLLRTGGIIGDGQSDLHWRWTPSPEERLLAQGADEPAPLPSVPTAAPTPETRRAAPAGEPTPSTAAPAIASPTKRVDADAGEAPTTLAGDRRAARTSAEWPGFRGPARDGIIPGTLIETDWSRSAPIELWRRPIGPGWSSFAVHGNFVYTQEQRGDDEIVSCYNLTTGAPAWRHRDAARFWESNGGAGPRATPTVSGDRVYTFGATGIVNALNARDGAVIWSRNAASDTGATNPGWGFASSPLVVDDVVVVAAAGRLVAYDVATGNPRWIGQTRGGSYSSPHLTTIVGVPQILLLSSFGATSVAPADGAVLWDHAWPGVPIVQPARTSDGDVLITIGDAAGGAVHGASRSRTDPGDGPLKSAGRQPV